MQNSKFDESIHGRITIQNDRIGELDKMVISFFFFFNPKF